MFNMKYIDLINQFIESGYRNFDFTKKESIIVFYHWLKERNKLRDDMLSLLDFLGIDYNNGNTAEINKCIYDTCTNNLSTKAITNVVTFSSTKDFILGDFTVEQGKPILAVQSNKGIIKPVIPEDVISTYMVHNPYSKCDFDNLSVLHNNGFNIIASVYGDNNDKDMRSKIKSIHNLEKSLNDNYISKYDENRESYLYVVASKRRNRY